MKLSVVMIVKNEEAMLGACLDSVKGADEIVVLDTGSTDSTADVAVAHGARVFVNAYKWKDDFADARNAALDLSFGDWILSIDADETLEEGGIEKIRAVLQAIEAGQFQNDRAFNIYLKNSAGGSHLYPRLFKRGVRFTGASHEVPDECITRTTDLQVLPITINYGSSPAHAADPDLDLRILLKVVTKSGKKKFPPRMIYYLAREYFYRSNWKDAMGWFNAYIGAAVWFPEKSDAYLLLARCLWVTGKAEEARENCMKAIMINANFKEALRFMGEMSWPENKERWDSFADLADNRYVLFVRG